MFLIKPLARRVVPLLVLLLMPAAWAADALSDARQLIGTGKTREAFALLEPLEEELAGQSGFDLLFGIAAVDSGQHTRGVFALERVLSVEPDNPRARAEIARAYLALGETETARQEFLTVRGQDIPPEVARSIDRYLDAVERVDAGARTTLRGYLEVTAGHDSNVNAGPKQGQFAVPGIGSGLLFTLDDDSRANRAAFGTLGAGVALRHPLTQRLALTAGLSGWHKLNDGKSRFDTAGADADLGLTVERQRNRFSLTAQYNNFWLDDKNYRSAAGATGQWQHHLNARNQLSAFIQYARLDYDRQKIRDADRWIYGGAFAHALRTGQVFYASVYGIDEKEKEKNLPHLGHDGYGLRLGAQTRADQPLVFFANLLFEQRRYGGREPAFLKTRDDKQFDASLGARYQLAKSWLLTPRISHARNSSSIKLNTYDRTIVSISLRREF